MDLKNFGWKKRGADGKFPPSAFINDFLAVVILSDRDEDSSYVENCLFNKSLYGDDVFVTYKEGEIIHIDKVKAFLAYDYIE